MPVREPVSRRARPAKPPLSRSAIVAAALAVMDEEGLGRVTMRRLAQELDTAPAALYVYLSGVAELHGLLLDEVIADVPLPEVDGASAWQDEVVATLVAYTEVLLAHPGLARSALTLRPSGPRHLALLDALLSSARAADVPPRQAAWGVDRLLQLAVATAAEQTARRESIDTGPEEEQLRDAVEAAATDHDGIAWALPELFSGPGRRRLVWGFHALLNGIATTTEPEDDA